MENLPTGNARMDETHEEFVALLNGLLALPSDTPPQALLARYRELVEHTVGHFGQEDRWMLATGVPPDHCHIRHHAEILAMMAEVERHHVEGDDGIVRRMAEALADWFPQHAATMDAGLAQYLHALGYDTAAARPDRPGPDGPPGSGPDGQSSSAAANSVAENASRSSTPSPTPMK